MFCSSRVAAAGVAALLSSTALAQDVGLYSNTEIVGHVIEPNKVPATDARIGTLKLPAGFKADVFARDLIDPRMLAVAEDGTVYVTRRDIGDVVMLKDTDGDGRADAQKVVANRPQMHGIAIDGDKVYLATIHDVYVATINKDGTFSELDRIIDDLPDAGQHPNRTLAIGPDGLLYISVGSTCNACAEANPENATMLKAKPDGSSRTVFASGLRNTIGFAFNPETKQLWGFDHGIDWLGDNEQSEELNLLVEGKQYGWPYIYADSRFNPQDNPPAGITLEDWAKASEEPAMLYTPHSAPMQMVFYDGTQFPSEFKGDAFIAMRGSWNRKPPSGYEVVRVKFDNGRPTAIEPFLTGFMNPADGKYEEFARLAGVAVAKDGALLVADDDNGVIYRVTHSGADAQPSAEAPLGGAGQMVASGGETQMGMQTTPTDLAAALLGGGSEPKLTLRSASFDDKGRIPLRFSAAGEDVSPALSWSGAPTAAKTFAIFMEDPDVKEGKPFVHWIAANIPADLKSLPQGIPGDPRLVQPEGMIQGANSRGTIGYSGPNPPVGDKPHRYHLQLFALDVDLDLKPGAGRKDFLGAMKGHVLAAGEIVGTFERRVEAQAKGDPLVLPGNEMPPKMP